MMTRANRPSVGPRKSDRGFSFIEILVVMGIISVLVGGIIVTIGLWAEKGPQFDTGNTVSKAKMMIENWHAQMEMYPPSDVTRIADVVGHGEKAQAPANKVNEGIEAVYQALLWPGYKGEAQWKDSELGNTDQDELRKAVNKLNTKELKEIIDAYGNPLVYFHNSDYQKYAEGGPEYMSRDPDWIEMPVNPVPYTSPEGGFRNPASFQIWSMGPDGEPNTDDDITTWD